MQTLNAYHNHDFGKHITKYIYGNAAMSLQVLFKHVILKSFRKERNLAKCNHKLFNFVQAACFLRILDSV